MLHLREHLFAPLAVLTVLGATCFATDQLENGGFETGDLTGWFDPSAVPGVPNAILGAPAAGAQDGNVAARLELAFGVSELSQTFPASPGDEFNFKGWFLTENAIPEMDGFTAGIYKIVFRDENGNDLEPASVSVGQFGPGDNPGVEALPFLDFNSATDTWICSEATGVAPANTVEVVFLALNVDFNAAGPFPMWFDNINANNTADGVNLLENPSFETGDFSGWVPPFNPNVENAIVGAPGVGAQDGDGFAAELRLANGVAELRQSFPAAPGDEFNINGFMLAENVLPFGPTFGLYKIVFQDENGNDLEPASVSLGAAAPPENPGVDSRPVLDFTVLPNDWILSEAQGVAPEGTTQVVFLVLNVDFADGLENPMWFDNITASNTADGINLLANPSFATGDFTGWAPEPPPAGNGTVGAPGAGAFEGSFAALLTNEQAVGELRQTAPASPGDEFNLCGYMLTENMIPSGPSFGLYKIVFRDIDGNDLEPESVSIGQFGPAEAPGVESLPFLNEFSPIDSWEFSEAQGVAPAGTVEVLFLALNVDFAGGSNPIWFDGVKATAIKGDCEFELGDVNQSGEVDLLDVAPFVDILSGMSEPVCEADMDGSGDVDLLDVSLFVAAITGG